MQVLLLCVLVIVAVIIIVLRTRSESQVEDPRIIAPVEPDLSVEVAASASETPVNFSMLPRQFVVLDLETTGLDPARHEIIEIGAIRVSLDSKDQLAFGTLVKPEKKIPRRSTEINGITQAMVDTDGRSIQEALAELIEFIQDLPLVAFNADFDIKFLQAAARKHGYVFTNRYTCALKLARRAWPGLPNYKLINLAKMGNLPVDDAHRAVSDCQRVLIVFTGAASVYGKRIQWRRLRNEPVLEHRTRNLVG